MQLESRIALSRHVQEPHPALADDQEWQQQRALQDQHVRVGLTWAADGVEDMYVLRRCLSPQITLIHMLVDMSGHLQDLRHFQNVMLGGKGCARPVVLHEAIEKDGMLGRTLCDLLQQIGKEELWSHCSFEERVGTNILRYTSRASCTIFELLVQRCKSFPLKLFSLLQNRDGAEEVVNTFHTRPCLLDTFAYDHLSQYPSVPEVLGQDSLQSLAAVAHMFSGSIFTAETLHGTNARRTRQRITHRMSVPAVAMWQAVEAAPAWTKADRLHHGKTPLST